MYRSHEPGWRIAPNQQSTAEHLIPSSKGGPDEWWNIVAACASCNGKRGDMPIEQWVFFLKRNIPISGGEAQFVILLAKLSTFGIDVPIGQPGQPAPSTVPPDCPPLKEKAPAP